MLVESSKVGHKFAFQSLFRDFEISYDENFKLIRSSFRSIPPKPSCEWNKLNEKIAILVKAARNGLMIPFIEKALDLLNNIRMESFEAELKKYSYLDECDDIVTLNNNELKYLYYPDLASMYIISVAHSVERIRLETYEDGYDIESLEENAKRFTEEPILTIVENEISQMKMRVELADLAGQKFESWEPYNVFVKIGEVKIGGKTQLLFEKYRDKSNFKKELENEKIREEIGIAIDSGRELREPDKRNFLAHAGLERNVTQILSKEGKIICKV